MKYDLIVIGGGPAGLAAAYEAYCKGVKNILLIERDKELGGILNQCIHNGFGLHTFNEELTGPEYAERFIDLVKNTSIETKLDTMVLSIEKEKVVHAVNAKDGYMILESTALVLAMGCRERTRGAINTPGARVSGVMTAGTAQRFINIEGYMPGKEVVILGSGDIGLIMARRMTLEGANVKAVVELMPYSNGLNRNIVQCLEDYNVPLYLSHTVIDVIGKSRLEKVIISKVGEDRKPIEGSRIEIEADTLLLSVGLIPENELSIKAGIEIDKRTNGLVVNESMETSMEGVFACGNVLHVHDLVDFVTSEAKEAGKNAAKYIIKTNTSIKESDKENYLDIRNGSNINYTVPQKINISNIEKSLTVFMRVNNIYKDKSIVLKCNGEIVKKYSRQHMAPAEMEKIIIPKEIIEDANESIIISVE